MTPEQGRKLAAWIIFSIFVPLPILIVLASDGYLTDWFYAPRAREAIQAAVDACSTGSRLELARRIVDAKQAIRKVSLDKQMDLDMALSNTLRLVGCPAPP